MLEEVRRNNYIFSGTLLPELQQCTLQRLFNSLVNWELDKWSRLTSEQAIRPLNYLGQLLYTAQKGDV